MFWAAKVIKKNVIRKFFTKKIKQIVILQVPSSKIRHFTVNKLSVYQSECCVLAVGENLVLLISTFLWSVLT